MKRTDLIPGTVEYLTSPVRDWYRSGSHRIKRVRVLDDQPWADDRMGSLSGKHTVVTALGEIDVPERCQPASVGGGVLVEELDHATGKPIERNPIRVIQLGAFRDTWESGKARRDNLLAGERAKMEKRDAEIQAENDRANAAAKAIGGEPITRGLFGRAAVSLSLERAEEIAAAINLTAH